MNDELELPDGSCSVSDIQNYFKYIIEKHEGVSDNPPIRTYVNNIENKVVTFTIKTGYYLKLLTPETINLLGSTKRKKTKDKNGGNVPPLEIEKLY